MLHKAQNCNIKTARCIKIRAECNIQCNIFACNVLYISAMYYRASKTKNKPRGELKFKPKNNPVATLLTMHELAILTTYITLVVSFIISVMISEFLAMFDGTQTMYDIIRPVKINQYKRKSKGRIIGRVINHRKKIPVNSLCPCGSGLKYKKCHRP